MRIKSVHLISFGKFRNKVVDFNENITIIFGLNEAGKTTVVDAAAGVLFGFWGRREEARALRGRYRPWDGEAVYKAGVTIRIPGKPDYYIERDFVTNEAPVYLVHSDSLERTGLKSEELIERHLGIRSLQVFKSTLMIKQEEVSVLDNEELAAALSAKLTSEGPPASIRAVFKQLGKSYLELNRGLVRNTGNGGPIKKCQTEISRLEQELAEIDGLSADYHDLLERSAELTEEIGQAKSRLEEIAPLITGYRSYSGHRQARDDLFDRQKEIQIALDRVEKRTTELRKIETYLEENSRYEQYMSENWYRKIAGWDNDFKNTLERLKHTSEISEGLRKSKESMQKDLEHEQNEAGNLFGYKYTLDNLIEAERLSAQIMELENGMAVRKSEVSGPDGDSEKGRYLFHRITGLVLCLLSVFGIMAGNLQGYSVAAILLATGAILFFYGLWGRRAKEDKLTALINGETERMLQTISNYKRMLANLTGGLTMEQFRDKVHSFEESKKKVFTLTKQIEEINLHKYEAEEKRLKEELETITSELKQFYEETGFAGLDEYRRFYQTYGQIKRESEILRDAIQQYLGDRTVEEMKKELSVLSVKILNLQTQMDLLRCSLNELEYAALDQEEAEKQRVLGHLETELIKVRTSIGSYENLVLKGKDRWSLENLLLAKKAELRLLDIRKKGIAEAVRVLREAVEESRADIIPELARRASELLAMVTGGKYEKIGLDFDAKGLSVIAGFRDYPGGDYRFIEAGRLSTGTRDQVYLSLRVAIAECLVGGKACPLIFDDPFVTFDADRLKCTMEALAKMTADHQVIILTKDNYYREHYPDFAYSLASDG